VDFVFLGLTAYCILKPNKMKQRLKWQICIRFPKTLLHTKVQSL
jgi:hypothetical protein